MTSIHHTAIEPIVKIITDLDESEDEHRSRQKPPAKPIRPSKSEMRTFSGSVPKDLQNRSRSADNRKYEKQEPANLTKLLRTKDDQIEKLIGRMTELIQFNNQFAEENESLQSDFLALKAKQNNLIETLEDMENRSCESCLELHEQNEVLQDNYKALDNDINMMKTLVFRLNVQIERYQDKLRKSQIEDDVDGTTNKSETGKEWGDVNANILAPLLNAYEEMIHEKDDLIKEHETEMNKFTGKFKEIIEENNKLRLELENISEGESNWKEEKAKLEAQLDVCRSKAEVQSKRADVAKEKLVEVLRVYEQKLQVQTLDMERLQDGYSRTKGELIALKNLNSQPEVMLEGIKECHKLFEELKNQHSVEKAKFGKEVAEFKEENVSMRVKLKEMKDLNESLQEEISKNSKFTNELNEKSKHLKKSTEKLKESRNRLKARLRMALQWANKLEQGQDAVKDTWDELKQLETIVKHKEAQIRGLHQRHLDEVEKLQIKLQQREDTIRTILQSRANHTSDTKV